MVQVERLATGNPQMTADALEALSAALDEAATPLFIRLADVAAPPTALAAIDALHAAGKTSAAACRKLIDLQQGPGDVQEAAEDAVANLMTQGIIAQEADNWRYHNETHFPEQAKEPATDQAAGA